MFVERYNKAYNVTPTIAVSWRTTTLTRVLSNRIRLNDASRLHTVVGEYQIAANVTNPTKNSFYYDSHELFDNQEVTISSSTGAVPSSSSGPVFYLIIFYNQFMMLSRPWIVSRPPWDLILKNNI